MKQKNLHNHRSPSKTTLFICTLTIVLLSSCSVLLPISATGKLDGTKRGTATATNILGFWTDGDASIKTAAANGGITHISTVDTKVTTYLWVFRTVETIVVGD